jgi:hypothetical protein
MNTSKLFFNIMLSLLVLFFLIIVGLSFGIRHYKYTDPDLQFSINYPKELEIVLNQEHDNSEIKHIKFSGEIKRNKKIYSQYCDNKKYPASLVVTRDTKSDVENEEDIENLFEPHGGVIEKIAVDGTSNSLIVGRKTGPGMCSGALYKGMLITDDYVLYSITFFGSTDGAGEDKEYDIARTMFESFKLID